MKKAIAYGRFSPRPNASECDSIEKQLERIRAYCVAHEYTLIAEYCDHAESGAKIAGREQFQLAIAQVCQEKATLIVYDLFRLARGVKVACEISEQLDKAGAHLACLAHQVDTNSSSGRLLFNILSSLGQFQREQIAERTRAALIKYQYVDHRRVTTVEHIPYGYMLDPFNKKKIRPCAAEQAVIRDFTAWYQEGLSLKQISAKLNAQRRYRRAKRWLPCYLRQLIARHKIPGPPEVE